MSTQSTTCCSCFWVELPAFRRLAAHEFSRFLATCECIHLARRFGKDGRPRHGEKNNAICVMDVW